MAVAASVCVAQKSVAQPNSPGVKPAGPTRPREVISAEQVERNGIEVRVKDIARFRGVRSNQLMGYGLVVGLESTGDTKKTPFTQTLLANALKRFGTLIDPTQIQPKNVAAVAIIAELPPFATPGNRIDVTVQSIGDATSLKGGTLLQTPLYGQGDETKAMAVAQGAVSVGGMNVGAGGAQVYKNHVNAGKVPGGGIVERVVPYQMVFGNQLYLELDDPDLTTANRLSQALDEKFPGYLPRAIDGGTIEITLPKDASPVQTMALIEGTSVYADIPALVLVDERTGTIIVGGNVKIGPALITRGNLRVSVARYAVISQPAALSKGETVLDSEYDIQIEEDRARSGEIPPFATLSDLARLFDALDVSAQDVISILQALKSQGALKARLKIQ